MKPAETAERLDNLDAMLASAVDAGLRRMTEQQFHAYVAGLLELEERLREKLADPTQLTVEELQELSAECDAAVYKVLRRKR